jgi:cyclohexyl-isocyanide hydratase
MSDTAPSTRIAMVIYPDLTQLDLTGPFEVLSRMPGTVVDLVGRTMDPVTSDRGLILTPTATFADCPAPDILFVPGGPGQVEAMEDDALLGFVRQAGATADLVTSVCTGSLILGAAGLLQGKRATCHWISLGKLALLGATPVNERVVEDGNVITAAGVSSGIDFALTVAARLHGQELAEKIQLFVEYDPEPPFDSGSADKADPAMVADMRAKASAMLDRRDAGIDRAAQSLAGGA